MSIGAHHAKGRLVVAAAIVLLALLALWGSSQQTGGGVVAFRPVAVSGTVGVVGGPPNPSTGGPAIPVNHPEPLPFRRILVTGTTTGGTDVHLRLRADRHGRFALGLPTGTYTVTAMVIGNAPITDQPSQQITVRSGHPVNLRVIYPAP